jgi:hypothetical protein
VERLKEVAHGMDTQVNESFNNTFSWLAPKNKVYCGSQSLKNQLCMGIGINLLGTEAYFNKLFDELGISMTPNVIHFLQMKETKRLRKLRKVKLPDTKRDCLKNKYEQLRKDTAIIAQKERTKRDGTYKSGQNVLETDGSEEDVIVSACRSTRPPAKKKPIKCKCCGGNDHAFLQEARSAHTTREETVQELLQIFLLFFRLQVIFSEI